MTTTTRRSAPTATGAPQAGGPATRRRIAATPASAPKGPAPAAGEPAAGHDPLGCRAHEVLARVGDKWSVYVIHVLGEAGTLRFGELRQRVEGISQRMLAVTLRGIVGQLVQWSQAHLAEIDAARARYDVREPGWATAHD